MPQICGNNVKADVKHNLKNIDTEHDRLEVQIGGKQVRIIRSNQSCNDSVSRKDLEKALETTRLDISHASRSTQWYYGEEDKYS